MKRTLSLILCLIILILPASAGFVPAGSGTLASAEAAGADSGVAGEPSAAVRSSARLYSDPPAMTSTVAGDVNGDGKCNNKDVTRLLQHLAGWNVAVNENVSDINGDGKCNNKDVTRLLQHLAGWNVEIFSCSTLLFYEDFESYSLNDSSVLSSLGWTADSPANGAYKGNTASYSIKSYNGSRQLYISNNKNSATDSYVIVVPASLMGKFHESNYTYQFDVTYADAAAADRYIALVSDYDGQTYNTFHFRNRGTANNQVHTAGSWYTYDAAGEYYAANTDSNSIVTKLLGQAYDANVQAFRDISVSIRYVVDWQNGNSVYMRVNDAGYPGTGKWTLVSKYSPSGTGGAYLDPDKFGGAIVLKTGGKQNGYIDNIIVWAGTGEEPASKANPRFTSKTPGCSGHKFKGGGTCADPLLCVYCRELSPENEGHVFSSLGISGISDRICSVCGALESNIGSSWLIEEIPALTKGTLSSDIYRAGQAPFDKTLPMSLESEMMVASGVTSSDFTSYKSKLQQYQYVEEYSNSRDGNLYASYYNGTNRVYAYYTDYSKTIRVILDRTGDSISGFGYSYEAQPGEKTVVYQYGLPMDSQGNDISTGTENKINCGMMYVIKLADGKLMVIDGGGHQQFDDAESTGLMNFMREITGKPTGKIDIAAWYITHCHSDHMAGFALFLKKYSANLSIERMIFNFPSSYTSDGILSGHASNYQKLIGYIGTYIGSGVRYLKIHTGESVTICNLTVNCLYTHEDLTDPKTNVSQIDSDFNNSTTVSRLDFDGLRFMLLGDVNQPGMNVMLSQCSDSTLKADILQLAHHVYNNLQKLYNKVQAYAVFAPQSQKGAYKNLNMKNIMATAEKYITDPDLLRFGASGTYGYAAGSDGKATLVYSRNGVDGGEYTGWSW